MSRARVARFVALVVVAAGLAGCEEEGATTTEQPTIFDRGADQVMVGVEHYLTRDGLRRGILHADTAFTFQEASRIELSVLEIRFYGDEGADRGVLTGASGEYEMSTGDFTVRGGVTLEGRREAGEGPSRLETDSLRYDAAADRLRTEARYTLTYADGTVERGSSLDTDPALTDVRSTDLQVVTPDVAVPR